MANPPRDSKAVKTKKTVQKTIAITAVILLIITALVLYYQRKVKRDFANKDYQTIKTAEVVTGSIRTSVSGSGTLTSEDTVDVDMSVVVDLDEILVEEGDRVEEGTLLASTDTSSVLTALSTVQKSMDELDAKIRKASSETVSSTIKAGVNGRVKAVFAHPGDDVATVMYENGALALLSLDGKMSVTVDAAEYAAGDTVTVVTSDGKELEGTVKSVTKKTAKILVTDDGTVYHDSVTVDGKYTGTLEINEPLKVTGYAGTISYVSARLNAKVSGTSTLFSLKDTAYAANYNNLLNQRADYEEMYQKLVKIYKDGGVVAPVAGVVTTVNDPDDTASASSATSATSAAAAMAGYTASAASYTSAAASSGDDPLDEFTLAVIDPGKVMSVTVNIDETDILSLKLGQEVSITVESIGNDTYYGTVTEIDTNANSSDGVTAYATTVKLERMKNMLPGMTAEIAVTIEGVENALLVPADAVHRTSSTSFVYTGYDTENKVYTGMTEVEVGISNGKQTEIKSGLNPGDTVYYTEKETTFTFGGMTFTASGRPGAMPAGGMGGMGAGRPRS